MNTFLVTLLVFALAITGMAVGVIFAKKPLKGSCGGLNQMRERRGEEEMVCSICGEDPRTKEGPCEVEESASSA